MGFSLAANGSQVKFDGYLAIYNDSDKNKMLPDMAVGDNGQSRSMPSQNNISLNRQLAIRKRPLSKTLEENGLDVRQPMLRQLKPSKNVLRSSGSFNALNRQNWEKLLINSLLNISPDIVNVTFTAEMEGKLG